MNVDGSYWKPEQYPKTTWVVAKEPPVDPSNLSGFNVNLLILLMSHLTPTINCLKIRMAKCLPGILVLTAGMVHL